MQLYDYYRSSCAYRVRIALNLKGLAYTIIPVDLTQDAQHAPEYQAKNPQALVPTLIDGAHTFTQSLAIIAYLDEQYPTPPLLPKTPIERAQARALALSIACDIHPVNNLRILNCLRKNWQANPEQIQEWYQHWIQEGFTAIEKQLASYPRQQAFCVADSVSVADICLIPQVYNALRFNCPMDPYPTIQNIYDHCTQIPAFMQAAPSTSNNVK